MYPKSAKCKPLSFDVCNEFVKEFDLLYEARDVSVYPLGNPMRRNADSAPSIQANNVQFPVSYCEFLNLLSSLTCSARTRLMFPPPQKAYPQNSGTGVVLRTFPAGQQVTVNGKFSLVNPATKQVLAVQGCRDNQSRIVFQAMSPGTLLSSSFAWYKEGAFDLARNTWPDASGSNDAVLSGSDFTEQRQEGHGASLEVVALQGTTTSKINFGPIIKEKFTICSVTRYTGGTKKRILTGKGSNWLHGHWGGNTEVAWYGKWTATEAKNINPVTSCVVMCGTNAGSQLKLANGVSVGTKTGSAGSVTLQVNQGNYPEETSDLAIAEVVVWDRGLSDSEMHEASGYLMNRFLGPNVSKCSRCWEMM